MSEGEVNPHPAGEVTAAPIVATDPVAPAKTEISAEPAKAETPVEAPMVESPAIQPRIEETAQAEPAQTIATTPAEPIAIIPAEPIIETIAEEPTIAEIPTAEAKMPPVAQLAEPVARLVEAAPATPPDFLREHTTRTIAAKPPLRAEARPGFRPKPKIAAKPELKAPPKDEPRIVSKTESKTARSPRETPRQTRFALLAASVAICACIGSAIGAAGFVGLTRIATGAPAGTAADVQTLREQVAQLAADIAATRTNVEHINRNSGIQFGKITERFDRVDRAQAADPTAKLVKITETLDKLEKRIAALPITPAPTAAATPAPANDITGSIGPRPAPEVKAPPKPPILEGYILRRVYDGVALVESRMGVVELVPGAPLPGGGRVEDIRREDGHWVVVTSRGLIVSQR